MPADNVWKCPRGPCDFSSKSKPLVDAHCEEAKGRLLYICAGCRYTQCDASSETFQTHLRVCEAGQEQLAPFSVEDRFHVRARMTWAVGDDLRAGSLRAVQFPARSLRFPPLQPTSTPNTTRRTADQAGMNSSFDQGLVPSSRRRTTIQTTRQAPGNLRRGRRGTSRVAAPARGRPQDAPRNISIAARDAIDLTGDSDEALATLAQDSSAIRFRQDSGASFTPGHGEVVKQYKFVYEHPELIGSRFTYEEEVEESYLGIDYPCELVFDYSNGQSNSSVKRDAQAVVEDGEEVDWKAFGETIFGTGHGVPGGPGRERGEEGTGWHKVTEADQSIADGVEERPVSRSVSPLGSEADAPGETDSEYEAWFESDKGE
ncbi:hypothetical protein HII31_09161 [Pseudocercospora fuligena]|uniref:Uncharacterized protein n=1 Tax=Pseudocercospora fuligena TaxID=685502 RepID=A0A8H6REA5_9PEZI|nr:hypothetical protein HII31_09161 [Pseudocercospora fuligena]